MAAENILQPKSFPSFRHRSLRFRGTPTSVLIWSAFLLVITLCSLFADVIAPYNPNHQGNLLTERYQPPSAQHLFGTDKFSRDVFSRVLYGGRISLGIAFGVMVLSLTIGLIYGTIAGYWEGIIDSMMMRLLDFLMTFPAIFLIITIVAVFHPNHWYLVLILSLVSWMETARLVRAEVLSVKSRDFVLAARGLGLTHWQVIRRHIIPNCLTPVLVAAPFKIAEVILVESTLSFLGVGVQPPVPSWGNIIENGRQAMLHAWWIATFPGIFIALTVMSFNAVGERLKQLVAPEKPGLIRQV